MPDRDSSPFERAILPHLDAAYNVARWMLRDESDAHDVVQESFMRAFRYFDSLRGADALPWLLQIVRNTACSLLERRRDKPQQSLPEDVDFPDESARDPALQYAAQLDVEALRRAVENLPDDFRDVIVLRELEGLSYKQIALVTGVSIGTVMSRISRARRRLQAAVDPAKELDHGM